MGTGYVRQSAASIVDAEVINAAPLNAEFNAIKDAFDSSTGHSHDGTSGEGPQISLTSSVSGILPLANGGTGSDTASGAKVNLGLDQVNNTSDANKPISTLTAAALAEKIAKDGGTATGLGFWNNDVNDVPYIRRSDNGTTRLATETSPALLGTPTAPTATVGTNTTQLATTAFVETATTVRVLSTAEITTAVTAVYISIPSGYDAYELRILRLRTSEPTALRCRMSLDGSAYKDGASDYNWSSVQSNSAGPNGVIGQVDAFDSSIPVANGVGDTWGVTATVDLDTELFGSLVSSSFARSSIGAQFFNYGGKLLTAGSVTSLALFVPVGTMIGGKFILTGIK